MECGLSLNDVIHGLKNWERQCLLFWNRKCEEKKKIIFYNYTKEMKHGVDK